MSLHWFFRLASALCRLTGEDRFKEAWLEMAGIIGGAGGDDGFDAEGDDGKKV